jgi:hypothetical protein
MGKKVVLIAIAALVMVLGLSGVALAYGTTPQDIYNDYADNGQLDNTYTDAELQAYLDDALIDQYGDPTVVTELDALVTRLLQTNTDPNTDPTSVFPMTGAQLMLIGIGALALVGVGLGLRRVGRSRA